MEEKVGNYQDEIYHFKGLWDLPSICGLKLVKGKNKTIVIATDLFDENPGTSITEWNTKLAKEICDNRNIKHEDLIFIEHTPKKNTKLSFNRESFFQVTFDLIDDNFDNPQWKELTKEDVDKLITE